MRCGSFYNLYQVIVSGLLCLMTAGTAYAESIKIEGQACEKLGDDVSKASARIKAADKAAFWAVSNLDMLKQYRQQLDLHDFNVMVYAVVDEYLEDVDVKSTADEEQLCASVSAYVAPQNLEKAVNDTLAMLSQEESLEDEPIVETNNLSEAVSDELQKATLNKQLQDEALLAQKEVLFDGTNNNDNADKTYQSEAAEEELLPDNSTDIADEELLDDEPQPLDEGDNKALVYVMPMAFFDNTESAAYADFIKQWFENNDVFLVTDNQELADYVVSPRVLRAKTDPINRETNRLQMVVAMDVEFRASGKKITEHQNRFVLYQNDENEQQTAYNLMKKLFTNTCEILAKSMLYQERQNGNISTLPNIITPQ